MKTYQLSDITETEVQNEIHSTYVVFYLDDENTIAIDSASAYFSDDNRENEIKIKDEWLADFFTIAEHTLIEHEQNEIMRKYAERDERGELFVDERAIYNRQRKSALADL